MKRPCWLYLLLLLGPSVVMAESPEENVRVDVESLVATMENPGAEMFRRLRAAEALVQLGDDPAAARGGDWVLARAREVYFPEEPRGCSPEGWYQGYEDDLVHALGTLGGEPAHRILRGVLREGGVLVHVGSRAVRILLEADLRAENQGAVLDWTELLMGPPYRENLLALITLHQLSGAGRIEDPRRFLAIWRLLRESPEVRSATHLRTEIQRVEKVSRRLEGESEAEVP